MGLKVNNLGYSLWLGGGHCFYHYGGEQHLRPGNKCITFGGLKHSELLRLVKQDGWFVVRQTGGHIIMRHNQKQEQLTIPYHGRKEIGKGLLLATLKKAKLDIKQE